jgi:hypothetical protein
MTFVDYIYKYRDLKKAGKLKEAKRLIEKHRQQVLLEMAAKRGGDPLTRFERDDVI